MTEQQFIDRKGDMWIVRQCYDDDNCVAVERWMHYDDDRERDEPNDDLHIPLESLGDLIEALRTFDREAGSPTEGGGK